LDVISFIDISKNCPVVQLVKLTTLKAAQKYQKADDRTIFARNLSTGIRLIYIFDLPNIYLHKNVRVFNKYNNYYFSTGHKSKHFLYIRRKTVPVSQTKKNTYFAREVYILTLKDGSVYRTLRRMNRCKIPHFKVPAGQKFPLGANFVM
jgi:hypothetical protein